MAMSGIATGPMFCAPCSLVSACVSASVSYGTTSAHLSLTSGGATRPVSLAQHRLTESRGSRQHTSRRLDTSSSATAQLVLATQPRRARRTTSQALVRRSISARSRTTAHTCSRCVPCKAQVSRTQQRAQASRSTHQAPRRSSPLLALRHQLRCSSSQVVLAAAAV